MKTMVLVPCMDDVQTEFCFSLRRMKDVGDVRYEYLASSLIYKARNDLGYRAIEENPDYILWLDSDIIFPDTLLIDLMADMKDRDIVTGIYHMRRPPYLPVAWTKLRGGIAAEDIQSEVLYEYPDDEPFEVEGCGFGCVLMRGEVLKKVNDKFGDMFQPIPGFGEDLSFCLRARGAGYKIWCDPRIQVGHKTGTIVTRDTFKAYSEKVGVGK